jgi:glutamate N-acetyltransferase / amino-acid N-acetyltransferase
VGGYVSGADGCCCWLVVSWQPMAVKNLQGESIVPAARGIVTTDRYPKIRSAVVGNGRIVGIAKGAGMIEPNMATMLVYILTDLDIPRETLRSMLPEAVGRSFNCISVDSDESTSDTVVLISSGKVPLPPAQLPDFQAALTQVQSRSVIPAQECIQNRVIQVPN